MSVLQRTMVGSLLLLAVSLGGCMEAATWWSKTQGIAFDKEHRACPVTQLRDGLCQSVAQQGAKP